MHVFTQDLPCSAAMSIFCISVCIMSAFYKGFCVLAIIYIYLGSMAGAGETTLLSTSHKYWEPFHDHLTHGLNPSAFISIRQAEYLCALTCQMQSSFTRLRLITHYSWSDYFFGLLGHAFYLPAVFVLQEQSFVLVPAFHEYFLSLHCWKIILVWKEQDES